jgi:3-phosphoglycerate kinase
MKSLENITVKNKKVIFRADLNVPVFNGKVTDYSRINSIVPSIKKLTNNKIKFL